MIAMCLMYLSSSLTNKQLTNNIGSLLSLYHNVPLLVKLELLWVRVWYASYVQGSSRTFRIRIALRVHEIRGPKNLFSLETRAFEATKPRNFWVWVRPLTENNPWTEWCLGNHYVQESRNCAWNGGIAIENNTKINRTQAISASEINNACYSWGNDWDLICKLSRLNKGA